MKFPKNKPARNKKYREWIRGQPCCLTGSRATEYMGIDPHHEPESGNSGMGTKCCDSRCLPIRHDLHERMEARDSSRKIVWARHNKDPEIEIQRMRKLWIDSGYDKFWS